ncbi:anti-sigma B factor antagonist [Streptosporangium subroseum]|uniref:Anti-sigma factor antagonist n=1 Tax=Streptosporangium subroseum TaxID=106412 RepID=A0A239PD25_9ACTN|nr:STAS domain-containing protein [Streptosporangium subroseum]SNT64309.1 anti-sigma B factor antagonist [Streptosporangium subroseum]
MDDSAEPRFPLTAATRAGTLVMHAGGALDFEQAPRFQREIEAALATPRLSTLIIEVSQVSFWDSSGLSGLLVAFQQARTAGIHLILAGVDINLRRRLTITGLVHLFDIRPTLAHALQYPDSSPTA